MSKNGKEYEKFVFDLQEALLKSEELFKQSNLLIESNKKIVDGSGIEREFDIYWEYVLGGIVYKTVIECKDYNRRVSIDKIDAIIGKLKDSPDIQGVFATKKGYQKGAEQKAKNNGIQLLIVREQNDSDWEDFEGNPFIKYINMEMKIIIPNRIVAFNPTIDKKWVVENEVNVPKKFDLNEPKDSIYIEDLEKQTKLTLYEIEKSLVGGERMSNGNLRIEESPNNSFLVFQNYYLKLKKHEIEYIPEYYIVQTIPFDFSKELIGVIEYLNKGSKKSIYRNGKIINEDRVK